MENPTNQTKPKAKTKTKTKTMFSNTIQMPSTKTVISTATSVAATAMLVRSIARVYLPYEFQHYIFSKFTAFLTKFSPQITLVIEEFEGLHQDQLFKAADIYLGTIISPNTSRFRVSLAPKETKISVSMERNQEIIDSFNGVAFKWKMVSKNMSSMNISRSHHYNSVLKNGIGYLELSFHKKHKESVFNSYLPYILNKAKALKEETKTLKLFTLENINDGMGGSNPWKSVNLDHPASFDTLAMGIEMKRKIIDDLERFVKRKEFYRRIGKAWKRWYLLYGPPGTGKSSLIAAMANYLKFDIYDLELTRLWNNSQFRRLLTSTANRSILVVEDIDCSIELQNRLGAAKAMGRPGSDQGSQLTLSGFLNFTDGLWSSCGDERIIVFTANHKERLDSALLLPGPMDVHIHMSYCTPCGFKMLASNYHEITQHPLSSEIEQLIEMIKVTPAEVGEQLLKDEDIEIALRGLIEFLQEKKKESEEIKASEVVMGPSEAKALPGLEEKKTVRKLKGEKIQETL